MHARTWWVVAMAAAIALACVVPVRDARGAVVARLQLDGIQGTANDPQHADWFHVLDHSVQVSVTRGASGQPIPVLDAFVAVVPADEFLPSLLSAQLTAQQIDRGQLWVAGDESGTFREQVRFDLFGATVTDLGLSGVTGGDATATIGLNMRRLVETQTLYDANGAPADTITLDYNFAEPAVPEPGGAALAVVAAAAAVARRGRRRS